MAISSETSSVSYTGNGVTTVFAVPFKFPANADLRVTYTTSGGTPVIQTLGVHYTLTGAGVDAGGSLTMLSAPAAASTLLIERDLDVVQETSFRSQGTFSPAVHEDALDYQAMLSQQLDRRITTLEGSGSFTTLVAGNGLTVAGSTLNVGAGNGIVAAADSIAVDYGGAPADVTTAAASAGVATTVSRSDHKHDITVGTPGTIGVGDAAAAGVSASLAASDHVHALTAPAAPADVTKAAASAGAATTVARSDHKHDVSTAAPSSIGTANAEGAATSLARSNHIHDHGSQTTTTHHAAATASLNGFATAAQITKLDAMGETFTGVVVTTDATVTTIATHTPADATVVCIEVMVSARLSTGAEAAGYILSGTFRRAGATTTQVGATTVVATHEDTAAWAATLAVSGAIIQVRATGEAGKTISWRARGRVVEAP